MGAKKLLRKSVIAWGITSALLAGVLIAGNVVCRGTLSSLLNQVIGGKRAIVSEEDTGIVFDQECFTKAEALKNGNEVTEKICEEGMVLLKNENNALPLKKAAKVSVFGKNSVKLVYGGSGSAAPGDGARKTIFDSLTDAGFEVNPELKKFYEDNGASGSGRSENPAMENSGVATLKTGETAQSKYTQAVKDSYDKYGDAAIVVLSRIAGENWDLPRKADDNADRHYLELDNNERDLLKAICDSNKFQHVIVLMNSSNYIDLGFLENKADPAYNAKIDAAINIGSMGGNGIMALGRILSGEVNPSGHTVDTVYTDYKTDPTWQNFGGNFSAEGDNYLNSSGKATKYFFVEYEESIYMGYRYYETRGHVEGETWYNQHVIYPFGHGLSYSTFAQEIVNSSALEAAALNPTEKFDVQIKVKNTSKVPGKQVVQLYAEAPYTAGGIEKSYKVLVGFAKTKLLAENEEETVTITVDPYDFASYDSHDKNGNSFKGYELEAGNYVFHAGVSAHEDFDTFSMNLASDAKIENDPVTGTKVEPLWDETTEHMVQRLSRSNFQGTFPQLITEEERTIGAVYLAKLNSLETTNEDEYTVMPKTKAPVTVNLSELYGKDYNDPLWEKFLDQLTVTEMLKLFNQGCYSTAAVQRMGIPYTTSVDGPTGMVAFLGNPAVYDCCYYCSECLVAQTYNLELAEAEGHAIGDESIIGNEKGDGLSYPGWYAPGVNLHRSPFSGRNTEYYSEDPFLSGKMAATVIKGVQEKGVYVNVKHFAVNDQETHRSAYGIATWLDEQALRELYLKPFEFAVKEGGAHGLMTSFNRIGTEWAGGSYRLVTTILRKEWGFVGAVICDFHTDTYMDSKQMLYAGGDVNLVSLENLKLQSNGKYDTPYVKESDPKDMNLLRESSHRLCYTIANSNIMRAEILGYKAPIWEVALTGATIGIGAALAVWGALVITFALLPKKEVQEDGVAE